MADTPVTLTATVGYGGGLALVHNGWTQDSGPAATIATPLQLTTLVTMTGGVGTYVFKYTVTKAGVPVSDTITVTLKVNSAPTVDAGIHADTFQHVTIPIIGTALDDGLPAPAALTTTWSAVPSDAVFGDVNDLTTNVTFPTQDTYVLTLTANDGVLESTDTDTIVSASPNDLGAGYDEATPDSPASELTDHTWFIDLSHMSVTWWATVNPTADGRDIRVTDGNNMSLPFDLIKFVDGNPGTGLLAIKKTATVASQDIRVWVGNLSLTALPATDPLGQYATYDSDYKGFYPDGGGNDRTVNQNNLTMDGTPAPTVGGVSALSGFLGTVYDGSDQYGKSESTDWDTGSPAEASLSGLVSVDAADNGQAMTGLAYSNGFTIDTRHGALYVHRRSIGDTMQATVSAKSGGALNTVTTIVTLADATWGHFFGSTADDTVDAVDVMINASGFVFKAGSNTTGPHDVFTVGAQPRLTPSIFFTGTLSAVGAHTIRRSEDWAAYQSDMLADQDTFWNTTAGDWVWTAA